MIRAALANFSLVEFPIAALLLFMAAWVVIVVQAWTRSPGEIERMSALPLAEDGAGAEESVR